MFDTLIESRPGRRTRAGSVGLLSLSLHASAIGAALWVTRGVARPTRSGVIVIDMTPPPNRRGPTAPTPVVQVPGPVGPVEVPVPTIPPIGIPLIEPGAPDAPVVGAPDAPVVPGVPPGDGQPYTPAAVDELPDVLAGPVPFYPERLRQAGIEGQVVLEIVVDTLGRAEPGSIRVVATPHQEFVAPAKDYVRGALFRPARVNGRAVRVLVRVPIAFRLQRR